MHLCVLSLLSLFAIITTPTGAQIKDGSKFHILKSYWPAPPDDDPTSLTTSTSWIACPTSDYNCECFWGGHNDADVQGGKVGGVFFQLRNFCGEDGFLNFYMDATTPENYNFYEANGDGTLLGTCFPQTAWPFTIGSGSQQMQTPWTVCNWMTSPNDVPNLAAEEWDVWDVGNAWQSSRENNFDFVSDYYVCESVSQCLYITGACC